MKNKNVIKVNIDKNLKEGGYYCAEYDMLYFYFEFDTHNCQKLRVYIVQRP